MSPARGFVVAMGLYFGLHVLLRVALSDSLELDEAEQILFGQWLQWGYSSQPPLYNWLQKGMFELLGHGVPALGLLKNLLLFALFGLVFLSGRRVIGDDRRAVLAAVSLLLIPPIAWESARDLTHTVIAAVFVAFNVYLALSLLERRNLARYAAFGCTVGLGLLSKSNFAVHLVALCGALLTTAEGRRVVFDVRLLVALLPAGLIYAPYGAWQWEHAAALRAGMAKFSKGGEHSRIWLTGKLIADVLPYLAPVVPILLLQVREAIRNRSFAHLPKPENTAEFRLLRNYFAVLLVVFLILIWFGGMGRMKVRWLYPFFTLAPVLIFAHVPASWLTPGRFKAYAGFVAVAATVIFTALLLRVPGAGWPNKATDLNLPFAEFAASLRAQGFSEGVIIAHNAHFAGNFRHQFGGCCPVFAPGFELPSPASGQGKLLIVWETEKSEAPPGKLVDFVRSHTGIDLTTLPASSLSLPYRHSPRLPARIGYVIVHPNRATGEAWLRTRPDL